MPSAIAAEALLLQFLLNQTQNNTTMSRSYLDRSHCENVALDERNRAQKAAHSNATMAHNARVLLVKTIKNLPVEMRERMVESLANEPEMDGNLLRRLKHACLSK